MARPRNPNRDKAMEEWLKSDGTMSTKELAEMAEVPESRIRKWKSEDKWKDALEEKLSKRKRGGQKGNTNAVGHGAPIRNKNAETHGAYSTIHLDDLPPEEREYIESITLNTQENMLRELQLLIAKENDLKKKIKALEQEDAETLHVDKVVEMLVPKSPKKKKGKQNDEEEEENDTIEKLKTAMKTVVKASPFDRAMKLEAELNKTHGRIIKLLDSIKSYELDNRRIELEEKKYRLTKQRLTGVYNVDPVTGEIDDMKDDENEDTIT
ncbi:hypothetical protein KQI42_09800 [Tissierella sp. MSJ-40]|uniref:PBSX phage terminase small subunit-like N-terminal domain-containing protein n=1 Tax=Tissierella simiarum TaxID=2841534 RepID=A0ABS6E5V0_9FIRM|nr:hypothetical protein [Tissierella simiarum]